MPVNQTYTKWRQTEFYNRTFSYCKILFKPMCIIFGFKVSAMHDNKTNVVFHKIQNVGVREMYRLTAGIKAYRPRTWSICFS